MTKAEAAAAWAEAKEALDAAQRAEQAAWEVLQVIAGRVLSDPPKRVLQSWKDETVPVPPKVVG